MHLIDQFLYTHWDGKSPLLLGCSGGPDSKALLYMLLEKGVRPLVAHIDHGWRKESSLEADLLRKEVEGLGLIFYSKKIEVPKQNKEAKAREERFSFFEWVYEKHACQALLLAHHENDWGETALQRVLEGAHLPNIAGMAPVSRWRNLVVLRPLLHFKKRELLDYLALRQIAYFEDSTNKDTKFLRSRMREEIFPFLNAKMGKEIEENCRVLAERSLELKKYLDRVVEKIFILSGPWGDALDLRSVERVEARHIIQIKLGEERLPRGQLETLLTWVEQKKANFSLTPHIFAHHGWVFLLKDSPSSFLELDAVSLGEYRLGLFELEVTHGPYEPCSWQDVWRGEFTVTVPLDGVYSLKKLKPGEGKAMKKVWNQKKIFPFLRAQIPVLFEKGEPFCDFLSEKREDQRRQIGIQLKFKALKTK